MLFAGGSGADPGRIVAASAVRMGLAEWMGLKGLGWRGIWMRGRR
jgi:hypothetical protein